ALELKLCKIPTIGTQSENQTLPNISLGSPIVFSGWALHWSIGIDAFEYFSYLKKACKKRVIVSHDALL
ncbi:hypothetical protein, partial [Helicobacter pylori]|uniref:hypothetical protein n=1 Tax=Helicobacter pylori TaxID=210 RepID=UPI001F51E2C2